MGRNLKKTNNESVDYDVGDLVWAKMRGYPPWPGKITKPYNDTGKSRRKNSKYIYFFGTENYGWVKVELLKPYSSFKDELSLNSKSLAFKKACKAIDTYILDNNPLIPIRSQPNDSFGYQSTSSSDSMNELQRKLISVQLESTPLDVSKVSEFLLNKKDELTFGLLNLSDIGSVLAMNLLNIGHKVVVWSPAPHWIKRILDAGAIHVCNPADVLEIADIIFSCSNYPKVIKDVAHGICSSFPEIKIGKAYVEISCIDAANTSQDISDVITSKGGRYLEVLFRGNICEADKGNLIFIAGGDKTLFDDCQLAFNGIAKQSFYCGEIGTATNMNIILHSIEAISLLGLVELMTLANRAGISQKKLIEILECTSLNSPLMMKEGKAVVDHFNKTDQAFRLLHLDVYDTIQLSESLELPCPVNITVNAILNCAKLLGQGNHNISALNTFFHIHQ